MLGLAHPAYLDLLPYASPARYVTEPLPRHGRQIENGWQRSSMRFQLFHRSLFGMVEVYNRLPARIVQLDNVSDFQSELTAFVKHSMCASAPSVVAQHAHAASHDAMSVPTCDLSVADLAAFSLFLWYPFSCTRLLCLYARAPAVTAQVSHLKCWRCARKLAGNPRPRRALKICRCLFFDGCPSLSWQSLT